MEGLCITELTHKRPYKCTEWTVSVRAQDLLGIKEVRVRGHMSAQNGKQIVAELRIHLQIYSGKPHWMLAA